ncbi:MAG: ImmA/IrrE family metallo-endopeptidase [Clostridia bacterium]|nr:ImmA/IrrE family metallo-endopeptidase [Clostridia bacterium]
MIKEADYSLATNSAYRIRSQYGWGDYSTPIEYIIKKTPGVALLPYSHTNNLELCRAKSESGFIQHDFLTNRSIIFYNDLEDFRIVRFTLAHEFGHFVLNHAMDNEITNAEANCFARNLLCPVPLADLLDLQNPDDYSDCFIVSPPAALVAYNFRSNDRYYLNKDMYDSAQEAFEASMMGYYHEPDYSLYYV